MASVKQNIPGFLRDPLPQVFLFGGKGGVGKTTCAAATALTLSRSHPQLSFLLVSTDPAHSLADSLVQSTLAPNLSALEFDAQSSLDLFRTKNRDKLAAIADRGTFLDDDDINRFLDLSLPGLDELMAFLQISDWIKEARYHCIVMDTAPTGHTLRLLLMPRLIRPWLSALDSLLGKHRYMKKIFSGTYEPDDVDTFLLDFYESVNHLEALLQDKKRALFVAVTLAESFAIKETSRLLTSLKKMGIDVNDVVVNKLYPENDCPLCLKERCRQSGELASLKESFAGATLWGLPLSPEEIRGYKALAGLWDSVARLDPGRDATVCEKSFATYPLVEPLSHLPLADRQLLIFAGKGGVGKTTLACATALKLAQTSKRVLLFSTDPAHSLSDCLDLTIGPLPTSVGPGLEAMEIDGQKEFADLKNEYAADLEKLLDRDSSTLDFTFDREVMDRILDLSPPGLDEVMALLKAVEFLFYDDYDILVLDAAPTGHLLRLLEMPELISDWLRVFFELFLKYKDIFKLPRISERMVKMSKDLKRLKELLQDSQRSALYAVTILTEMAAAETCDLLESCRKLGIDVPYLFCNLATLKSDCSFCSTLYMQETDVKKHLAQALPEVEQVVVFRQSEPKGVARLGALGKAIYG